MKKLLAVLIVLVLLVPVIGLAAAKDEVFTYGDGIKFGMSKKEVQKIAGVCPIRRGIWFKWQPSREPNLTNQADFSIETSSVTVNSVNEAISTGICL